MKKLLEIKEDDNVLPSKTISSLPKYLTNKYFKLLIISVFAISSIFFMTIIIYFLYNTISYHNQLSEFALELYSENPEEALAILRETSNISTEFITIIISIFAIIVTVWVGLNIYNVLSRDELKELQERINSQTRMVETMFEDDEIRTQQINSLVKSSTSRSYFDFQATFEKANVEYTASNYVAYCFKELVEEDNYYLIEKLSEIEVFYNSAMDNYYGERSDNCIAPALKVYDLCSGILEDKANWENFVLMGYLHVRCANLQFFISQTKVISHLDKCIQHSKSALGYWFPELPNTQVYHNEQIYSLMDIYNLISLSIYFIITQKKNLSNQKRLYEEMYKYYAKLEELLIEKDMEHIYPERYSLYMRNIGTSKDFLFHHDLSCEISEDCLLYYKKAISANPRSIKSYRNIISFRLKQFKYGYVHLDLDKYNQWCDELIKYAIIYKSLAPSSSESCCFLGVSYVLKYLKTKNQVDLQLYQENIDLAILCLPIKEKEQLCIDLNKNPDEAIETMDILNHESHKFNSSIKKYLEELKLKIKHLNGL